MSAKTKARSFLALLLSVVACRGAEAPARAPCCEQPGAPAGVTPFVVVADEVTGPSDGQTVRMAAGLAQPIKRDQVYPVLHTLYRHAMKRGAFEPINLTIRLYSTEAAARQGGETLWLATIRRAQGDLAPRCENQVPYDFAEKVDRAFQGMSGRIPEENPDDTCRLGERKATVRVDETFTRKPSYELDTARRAVTVTFPYLEMGKDEYIADLRFTAAMRDWIDHVDSLFGKVEDLQAVAFVGVHRDEPVVKIRVTRAQFERGLSALQDEIASHAAVTFASLGMRQTDDKSAEKEQRAFHTKSYKAALATLPKDQVFVSPKLK